MNIITQDLQWIREEAERCLYCVDAPCSKACPANINIAQFIRYLRYNDIKDAKKEIMSANTFGTVCGTICPSEKLCENKCVLNKTNNRPISIRDLQKFSCENSVYSENCNDLNGKKVAVVGAGPAGLSCATFLARKGYEVDVFEKTNLPGGLIRYEIPEFRIDQDILDQNLIDLETKNVNINYDSGIQEDDLEEIKDKYDALFLGIGLQEERIGEFEVNEEIGVYDSGSFLRKIKSSKNRLKNTVVIIGGGDSAIDAAVSAKKYGAERVILAYRRTRKEMPATDEEFFAAVDIGIELMYLVSPISITKEDKGLKITFIKNKLGDIDKDGRRGFYQIENSEFSLNAEAIVLALGKERNYLNKYIEENQMQIKDSNIFIGGDFYNGGKTIVEAVGEGKLAANKIDAFLRDK